MFEESPGSYPQTMVVSSSSGVTGAKPQSPMILVHFLDKKEAYGEIKICHKCCMYCLVR